MSGLTIPAIVLMITMIGPSGELGQAVAFPESMKKCHYIAKVMINDEKESIAAEDNLRKEGKGVEPRTKLQAISCVKAEVPINGQIM